MRRWVAFSSRLERGTGSNERARAGVARFALRLRAFGAAATQSAFHLPRGDGGLRRLNGLGVRRRRTPDAPRLRTIGSEREPRALAAHWFGAGGSWRVLTGRGVDRLGPAGVRPRCLRRWGATLGRSAGGNPPV